MATIKKTETNNEQNELLMLELRKVKALEKIAKDRSVQQSFQLSSTLRF